MTTVNESTGNRKVTFLIIKTSPVTVLCCDLAYYVGYVVVNIGVVSVWTKYFQPLVSISAQFRG